MLSITGFIKGNKLIPLNWAEHVKYLANLHIVQELLDFDSKPETYDIYEDAEDIKLTGYALGYIKWFKYSNKIVYYGMKYYTEQIKDRLLEYAEAENLHVEFEYFDEAILELYPLLFENLRYN